MAVRETGPGGPAFRADNPVGRKLVIAAYLSAADEAGRTEVNRCTQIADGAVVAHDSAEMTAEIAAGPAEFDWRRRGRLEREVSRGCRGGDENGERRPGESLRHPATFPIAHTQVLARRAFAEVAYRQHYAEIANGAARR
jgi:hypothetical protein